MFSSRAAILFSLFIFVFANEIPPGIPQPQYNPRPAAQTQPLPESPDYKHTVKAPPNDEIPYDGCELYNWWTYDENTCEGGTSCGTGTLSRSRLCNAADGWEFEVVPCSPCIRCEEGMDIITWLDVPPTPEMDLRYQNNFAATIVKIMAHMIRIESEGIQLSTIDDRYVQVGAHSVYTVPDIQVTLPNGQSCAISPAPAIPVPTDAARTREEDVYCAEKMPTNLDFNETPMYPVEDECMRVCDQMSDCQGCTWHCSLTGKFLWTTFEKCTRLPSSCGSFLVFKDAEDIAVPGEERGKLVSGRCGIDPDEDLPEQFWKSDLTLDHGLGIETCREICLDELDVYNTTLVAVNARQGVCECVTQCDRIFTDVTWETMVFDSSIPYFSFEKYLDCKLPERIEEIPIDYTIADNTLYASPCQGCSPDCTYNADFDTVGPADGGCHQMKGCSRFGLEVHCDFNAYVQVHRDTNTFTIAGCDAKTFGKQPASEGSEEDAEKQDIILLAAICGVLLITVISLVAYLLCCRGKNGSGNLGMEPLVKDFKDQPHQV